jgi:Secretion system C-terminal sorting domain
MKKPYLFLPILLLTGSAVFAQPCATVVTNGSSTNAFTNIRNATNAITVDNDLNTILFIHRNNASVFGGHSGQLRYDISTNGGTTWTNDQGIVNPLSVNGTNGARFPQVAIYNPVGNTVPANAYLSYLAPTVATTFNGLVSGVRQLNGTGNTETYNQPASTQTLIPNSMCKGAPGVFWAIDAVFNGTATTGFRIFKGVWNGSSDVVWTTNTTITPSFNTAFSGVAQVGDYHIAFDPTGQYGWVSVLTHLTGGPSPYSFYPVFYWTTDGGNTWSSAMQVDLGQYNCITANIIIGNFASAAFESDLTVDANGEPHLFTTVCNGNNAYAIFFSSWHAMFDITYHLGMWNAIEVATTNAGRATWGIAPNTATMDNQPMVSRSPDGTKIFFAWADNTSYILGQANLTPNLFSKAYHVNTHNWTVVRDFTSCNVGTAGQIIFPKLAAEVLVPSSGQYKMAVTHAIMTGNDPINVANFRFLNNLTWADADFIIPQPVASISIDQGSNWLLCPGSTLGLSVTGTYNQVLWSNTSTSLATTINAPGTYTVIGRTGCTLGADTITVIGLVATVTTVSPAICPGDSTLLSVAGNALNYTWNPGGSMNDSVMVSPSSTVTYTLTAGGDGGCTYTVNSTITVYPQPAVIATASPVAVCIGDSATITANGASTYNWQPVNTSGSTITVAPSLSTNYIVTGTDANGCMDTGAVMLTVNSLPIVTAVTDSATICFGDTVNLAGSGANNYVWTPNATLSNATASNTMAYPSATTDYVLTGTDANGCVNMDTVTVNVNTLPVITTSSNGPICTGDTAFLNASGASSYFWSPLNLSGSTVTDFPSTNQTYMVTGTDANGCVDSTSLNIVVNPLPTVTVTGNNTICAGDTVTMLASGANTYYWQPMNSNANPLTDIPLITTLYTVTGTSIDGCENATIVSVNVNPLPTVTLGITTSTVCTTDAPLVLAGTGSPAGGTYSGPGVSGTTFSPAVSGVGSQTITYVYTDVNGCSNNASDIVMVSACVGIEENAGLISTIYPNPFNEQVLIQTASTETVRIEVYSTIGQMVLNQQFNGGLIAIETANWPAGIYLVTVYTNEGKQTAKVVKE